MTIEGRAQVLFSNARSRARAANLPFDLDRDWIIDRLRTGRCEVTRLPFTLLATGGMNPFSPSLDQKAPGKGYTKHNTQLVCWIYNAAKNSASHQDVLIMARALCDVECP